MKVFVVFEGSTMTDVIATNDTVGPRDQATLQQWFADSPDNRFFLAEQNEDVSLPTDCKWWPNLNEYMESFGITLVTDVDE